MLKLLRAKIFKIKEFRYFLTAIFNTLLGYFMSLIIYSYCHAFLHILIIGFIGFTNAILGFWGEYWERGEMMRHALIGSLIFNISVSLIIFYVLQKVFLFLRKFN
jgi:hypothetical protein